MPDDEAPPALADRLDSWKEIAAYLRRGVTTVQRWERDEGLPVHRHVHQKLGSVYALRGELEVWWRERSGRLEGEDPAPAAPNPARSGRNLAALLASLGAAALLGWLLHHRLASPSSPGGPRSMLAVLPFQNLSESADDAYLADGVTEELITELARLRPERLGVIASTSVQPYKQRPKPIRVVGRELQVDYVVEGSVRHSDGRLRITAQLIAVEDEAHVWAEAYERTLSDVLRTQVDVAEAIAARLSIRLLPRSPAASTATSPEAAATYLKGLHFAARRDEAGLRRAVDLFRRAIALEPGRAAAHAALAAAYASLASSADAIPAREARSLAEASGRRALELDPDLPAAHASLTLLRCRFDWDWAGCEAGLKRVLALAPNDAPAHHWLGEYQMQRGRLDEAGVTLARARALDPLSPSIHTHAGLAHMYAGRHSQALACFDEALEIAPDYLLARRARGLSLVRGGRVEDGLAVLRQARSLNPRSPRAAADLGHALGLAGRDAEARALLGELEALARQRHVSAYDFAMLAAGLGDQAAALDWLERGFAEGATGIRWLKVETAFDALRHEPRFVELLRRIGLPD